MRAEKLNASGARTRPFRAAREPCCYLKTQAVSVVRWHDIEVQCARMRLQLTKAEKVKDKWRDERGRTKATAGNLK